MKEQMTTITTKFQRIFIEYVRIA